MARIFKTRSALSSSAKSCFPLFQHIKFLTAKQCKIASEKLANFQNLGTKKWRKESATCEKRASIQVIEIALRNRREKAQSKSMNRSQRVVRSAFREHLKLRKPRLLKHEIALNREGPKKGRKEKQRQILRGKKKMGAPKE